MRKTAEWDYEMIRCSAETHLLAGKSADNEVWIPKAEEHRLQANAVIAKKHPPEERHQPISGRDIYTGDNLHIMRGMDGGIADLIYLDPPFNSGRNYAAPIGGKKGRAIASFRDTWTLSNYHVDAAYELAKKCSRAISLIDSLSVINGESWRAYLIYMGVRLAEMHRLLKPTGSIYLHCDPTMSHGLKLLMDAIFRKKNFRGEIAWRRSTSTQRGNQHANKKWGANKDTILCYAASPCARLNPLRPLDSQKNAVKFDKTDEKTGDKYYNDSSHIWRTPRMGARPNLCYEWRGFKNPSSAGWRLSKKRMEEEYQKGNIVITKNGKLERRKYEKDYAGANYGTFWSDINPVSGEEDTGHPTQKPEELLERIIRASCPEGGLVLDPFCGCGTAMIAAVKLGRRWCGIDISPEAMDTFHGRLRTPEGKISEALSLPDNAVHHDCLDKHANLPRRWVEKTISAAEKKMYRAELYKKQGGRCAAPCDDGIKTGRKMELRDMHLDHCIARAEGGLDVPENWQLLCGHCNASKSSGGMEKLRQRIFENHIAEAKEKWHKARAAQLAARR